MVVLESKRLPKTFDKTPFSADWLIDHEIDFKFVFANDIDARFPQNGLIVKFWSPDGSMIDLFYP